MPCFYLANSIEPATSAATWIAIVGGIIGAIGGTIGAVTAVLQILQFRKDRAMIEITGGISISHSVETPEPWQVVQVTVVNHGRRIARIEKINLRGNSDGPELDLLRSSDRTTPIELSEGGKETIKITRFPREIIKLLGEKAVFIATDTTGKRYLSEPCIVTLLTDQIREGLLRLNPTYTLNKVDSPMMESGGS
jgi:hypothetical protein